MRSTMRIMIRRLFLVLFFLLFVSCSSDKAKRTQPTDTGAPNETEETKPYYFWKVEKQEKYLIG